MNLDLIYRWNRVVDKDDDVYFLGDFAFCSKKHAEAISEKLLGNKFFIRGNHDRKTLLSGFNWIKESHTLEYEGKRFYLCHYPKGPLELPDGIDISLHGHTHGNMGLVTGKNRVDVGVDCNDYTPISINDVIAEVENANQQR